MLEHGSGVVDKMREVLLCGSNNQSYHQTCGYPHSYLSGSSTKELSPLQYASESRCLSTM